MDVGVPSGAALGVVVHPFTEIVSTQLSLTYNGIAPGGRLSVQLDPLAALFPRGALALFADVQGGFTGDGKIPGHQVELGYDYVNVYGGLRLGRANGFHWNIEVGPTYLSATTRNFQSLVNQTGTSGLVIGDPTVHGWIVPTIVTGFEVVWP
jgi:hypothetical protein